jgi:hypothetical protein
MPWLASSQTLSNKEEYCSVPCRTLKNALIFKNECELVKGQLVIARDSISILNNITSRQDSLISAKENVIFLQRENEVRYIGIIENKNKIIEVKDKQIKQAKVKTLTGWVVATITTTLLVIKLL